MGHRPLKATDKRRLYGHKHEQGVESESGTGKPLADLFRDRRHPNGKGKRAS